MIHLKNPKFIDLIFRGTEEGFESSKCHEKIDNKGPTLMIARCEES